MEIERKRDGDQKEERRRSKGGETEIERWRNEEKSRRDEDRQNETGKHKRGQ